MAAKSPTFDASWTRGFIHSWLGLVLLFGWANSVTAQVPTVEPGLETAVRWRWLPEASDPTHWGVPQEVLPEPTQADGTTPNLATSRTQGPPEKTLEYAVQKGDSLYVIGKRYGVSVDHLKDFNEMKRDMIVIGQVLRIPSLADIQAMAPPPPPPSEKKQSGKPTAAVEAPEKKLLLSRPLPSAATSVARVVLMQAYLDRQGFSAGPIDGTDGPLYDAALRSYETANPDPLRSNMGEVPQVLRDLGGAYTEYQLRREDLRWIEPESFSSSKPTRKSKEKDEESAITLEKLMATEFLAYRSVWEFIAERYHCSESFLRRINSGLKPPIKIGATFIVPNVIPFEIEKALDKPLQPAADPAAPITATIVSNTRLEIKRSGKLIANLPISVARPGLRGRGTWKILDAIPRPCLTTTGDPAAPASPALKLPAGPNNPVGPIWINLTKKDESTPLPYGLHGTSIPGYMRRQESLGGFRMTNWNIAYAVRLLPVGTPLSWE
ncbi:MAG: LysM peptidoglycan-binding domain-containing protein [Prosthecobacter sp.]|nr:LysM peptidoglycan-binding domain-containing protein [Prosthecobacter sp.]